MMTDIREAARGGAVSHLSWRIAILAAAVLVLALSSSLPPLDVAVGVGGLLALGITLRWPLAGFVLLVFAVPWADGFPVSLGPFPLALSDVVVASVAVAWCASAAITRRRLIVTGIWTPYIALFLAAILLSVSQAADSHAALKEVVKWSEMAAVYLSAAYFLRTRGEVRVLVGALAVAGVSQAALGLFQFFFGLGPEAFIAHRLFLRAYGTFDQPNPYAGYLNMVWPFALSFAILSSSRRERVLYAAAVAMMAAAIFASQSRGALLAAFVAGCVLVSLLSARLRGLVWLGLLAAAVGAWLATFGLVPVTPFQRVLNAVGLGGISFGSVTNANFSAVERAAHWLAGVRMFAAHPLLGVGIGNYAVAYPAYHPRGWYASLEHAHNYYINSAAEAGIVGLTAYTLLAGSALWYSYAAIRRAADRFSLAMGLGILGALITTDFHNLFDVLYVHGMVSLLGLLMAFVPITLRFGAAAGTGD
jgi:putative inorganic carbon (HCO3(-)) transporter